MKLKVNTDGQWADDIHLPLKILRYDERVKAAVKIFLIFFATAAFSILIPVLHFVLVPGFLITAAIMAKIKYQQVAHLDLQSYNCPSCHKSFSEKTISFKQNDDSIRLHCYECHKNTLLYLNNEKAD